MHNLLYIFIILFGASSLDALSVLTEYRQNGIENIEKKLDLELTKKKYWRAYIKNKDNTFGYLEKYSNVLACNKKKSTLNLYTKNSKGNFFLKKRNSAFTGRNSGDKKTEGDLKTPVGIYKLVKKKDVNLDPFYGPLALVTSYPNTYDKYLGKTGHGIWIHGVPQDEKRDSYTKGCIALQNKNLKYIEKEINLNNTILIINENKNIEKIKNETLVGILSQLYLWRYAWIYNKIDLYLSFYDKKFVRYDGMALRDFKRYKKRIFKKSGKKTIIFKDINIIPYPNKKNLYQIMFKELYKSQQFHFSGNKVLVVKFLGNKKIKIVTEK